MAKVGNYRSKEEITAVILYAIKEAKFRGGIKTTRLMFLTSLSSKMLRKYLDELLNGELISLASTGRNVAASPAVRRKESRRDDTFHITQRGLEYLQIYDEMRKIGSRQENMSGPSKTSPPPRVLD